MDVLSEARKVRETENIQPISTLTYIGSLFVQSLYSNMTDAAVMTSPLPNGPKVLFFSVYNFVLHANFYYTLIRLL